MEKVFYEDVFRALNRRGVRYLIVGGVAVNLLGVPRMTKDLDLMLDLDDANLKLFVSAAKELGYRPRAPVALEEFADAAKRAAWRREKGALVFTLNDPRDPRGLDRGSHPHEGQGGPPPRQVGHRDAAQGPG